VQWKVVSLEPKSPSSNVYYDSRDTPIYLSFIVNWWCLMTIIVDKCAHTARTINIYPESMYICTWGNFSHVFTILPLYMAELFWGCCNISYLCYQSNHEWLKTYWQPIILYSICYVEIYTNYIEYQSFK
jgi:hypothetical protein